MTLRYVALAALALAALLAEITAAGVWSQTSSSTLAFTPTHVGLAGEAAGDGAGYLDFRDLIIEEFV